MNGIDVLSVGFSHSCGHLLDAIEDDEISICSDLFTIGKHRLSKQTISTRVVETNFTLLVFPGVDYSMSVLCDKKKSVAIARHALVNVILLFSTFFVSNFRFSFLASSSLFYDI